MNKLFIGGFPLDIKEIDLAMLIAPYGDIDTLKIVRDKNTKICKGYAFVEMKNDEGSHAVEEALNGYQLNGKVLTVKINEEHKIAGSEIAETENNRQPVYQKLSKPGAELKKKRPRRPL